MISKIEKYHPQIIGAILCLGLGMLSGYSAKAADYIWDRNLNKLFFNPPSWIFAPVWTILYIMMGIALGILWKDKIKNWHLIVIFIIQFIFNLIWSPIFFSYQNIGLAFLDICALWLSLVVFIFAARKQRTILFLFLPYVAWVSFALILNFSIYKMNVI